MIILLIINSLIVAEINNINIKKINIILLKYETKVILYNNFFNRFHLTYKTITISDPWPNSVCTYHPRIS